MGAFAGRSTRIPTRAIYEYPKNKRTSASASEILCNRRARTTVSIAVFHAQQRQRTLTQKASGYGRVGVRVRFPGRGGGRG